MEFWGEDWITFEDKNANGAAILKDDKITLDTPERKLEFYQDKKVNLTDSEKWRSLLKWRITLKSKPLTNIYSLELGGNWQSFNFFYQTPFPNPTKFMRDGEEWLFQHSIPGDPIIDHERSRKVDGSYAVYHKTKRDNIIGQKNYRTGKVLHIYVPKATDNGGKSTWCTLNIENGIYTVIIPQKFLNEAIYPIVINDTFGYATIGGSSATSGAAWVMGMEGTPASSGNANTVHFYSDAADNITGGIYNNSDPATLLKKTSEITTAAGAQWNTLTLDSALAVVGSTEYRVAVHVETVTRFFRDNNAGSGAYETREAYVANNMPAPCDWESTSWGFNISIYVTYTPSGGPSGNPWNYYAQCA